MPSDGLPRGAVADAAAPVPVGADAGAEVFGEREREYLESLPAVREVRGNRIYYSRSFREQCVRRYMDGEGPVPLFREAGLDPKLIGYKRIERAFARWTRVSADDAARSKGRVRRETAAWTMSDDARDRLIARQALRISELEDQLAQLRQTSQPQPRSTVSPESD